MHVPQQAMKKSRLLIVMGVVVAAVALTTTVVMAARDVPPPYAGLKNPLAWNDASAQSQGKQVYQKMCVGCHGVNGGNQAKANFSSPEFSKDIESSADYYFWKLSEGEAGEGMPAYKSSLSDNQRWQVLTYLWTMAKAESSAAGKGQVASVISGGPMFPNPGIALTSQPGSTVREITLSAVLKDASGKPASDQPVEFYVKKSFFTSDWVALGEALSDKDGKAVLPYTPSESGIIPLSARWGNLEATTEVAFSSRGKFYQAEAGIDLPTFGPELGVTVSVAQPQSFGTTPGGGIRLPGSTFSWLWVFIGVILLIWVTYFRVFRLVSHIPEPRAGEAARSLKLVPFVAMTFVLIMGAVLAFVILNGPYTHLHLLR